MWIQAFIGLGSNLNHPIAQINTAIAAMRIIPNCCLLHCSPLYRTPPLGVPNQPDYINAVAVLATQLSPMELLDQLQIIEQHQGRVRTGIRWDARTLDLDLLLYGEQSLNHPRLTIPHPHLHHRAFVLIPLADVANPDLLIPGVGLLSDVLKTCDRTGISHLA